MQHPHTEWIKLRTKHREAELQRNARTKEIADYKKQIMPAAPIPQPPTLTFSCLNLRQNLDGTQTDDTTAFNADTHIRPSKEIIYETPKREPAESIMMMIMTTGFSTRMQRGLVEKM